MNVNDRPRNHFRAGDIVAHRPSGEEWILAADEEPRRPDAGMPAEGTVFPAGWPETLAYASDCTLVTAATDVERLDMLRSVAAGTGGGARRAAALRQLAEVKP